MPTNLSDGKLCDVKLELVHNDGSTNSKDEEEILSSTHNDYITSLDGLEEIREIHPAQDFIDQKLYYGVQVKGKNYLISSKRQIIPFEELSKFGLKPYHNKVNSNSFPIRNLQQFFNGELENDYSILSSKIISYLKRYVYFKNEQQYTLFATWVIGTYFFKIFRHYPYIHINAQKESGKTTLMELLMPICFNGTLFCNPTEAVIYRSVQQFLPTMFIDEAEKLTSNSKQSINTGLLEVLNSGYNSSGKVMRCQGDNYEVVEFSSFCPKMLAGINQIDGVLADRTISIQMTKSPKEFKKERYFNTDNEIVKEQRNIRELLYYFALDNVHSIFENYKKIYSDPDYSKHIMDRNGDLWSPLISIAILLSSISKDESIIKDIMELCKQENKERKFDDLDNNSDHKIVTALAKLVEDFNNPILNFDNDHKTVTIFGNDLREYLIEEKVIASEMVAKALSIRIKDLFGVESKSIWNKDESKSERGYQFPIAKIKQLHEEMSNITEV